MRRGQGSTSITPVTAVTRLTTSYVMDTFSAVLLFGLGCGALVAVAVAAPQPLAQAVDEEVTTLSSVTCVAPADCSAVESSPLCAFDPHRGFKTFDHKCHMNNENNCNCGTYSVKHAEPCTDEEVGVFQLKLAQRPRICTAPAPQL